MSNFQLKMIRPQYESYGKPNCINSFKVIGHESDGDCSLTFIFRAADNWSNDAIQLDLCTKMSGLVLGRCILIIFLS